METVRIGSDELELELLPELGARLHRVRAFGNDVLRTPDERFEGLVALGPGVDGGEAQGEDEDLPLAGPF